MPGASATVEIQAAVTATTSESKYGNFFLAWTKTTVAPEFYMTLIGQQTNVGASSTNGRSPLSGPGFLQGLALPTTGLNRVRVVASGLEVANLPGPAYLTTIGDLFRETQELYENPDDATMVTGQQFLKLNQGLEVNPATSWLEITTGSGWSTTSEQTLYTLVPVNMQRA
jgi:hypothetical protein